MAQPRRAPGAGAGAGTGAAVGAAGGAAGVATVGTGAAGAGAGLAGAGVAAAGILAGFLQWLAALREQHQRWLSRELGRYGPPNDIAAVIRQEMLLEREFARNAADRLASAMPQALAITDPREREARVRQLLADEQRYAGQRSEAMAARAIAALTRAGLRASSPLGAFWKLGIAQKHTEGCEYMAGKFWPWPVLDRVHPPRHYGCFVGGTRVWGPSVLSAMTRRYEGEILRVAFRSGREIGITPNHPVLQRCGWVAADALRVGDEVVCCSAEELGLRVRNPSEVQMPAAIEHVAGALADAGDVQAVRVPVATEDFHGDGREGEVDVVRARGLLRYRVLAAGAEQVSEFPLGGGDGPTALLAGDGTTPQRIGGVGLSTLGFVSGLRLGSALLRTQAALSQAGAFAPVAHGDPRCPQHPVDGRRRHAVGMSDPFAGCASGVLASQLLGGRQLDPEARTWIDATCAQVGDQPRVGNAERLLDDRERFVGQIATDQVVGIERSAWAGHVYNLETREGWYSAEGIVAHNCTSSLHSYADAILAGWMSPSDVPDTRDAVRAAIGVVMEQDEADGLLAELDLRDRLLERGVSEPLLTAITFEGVS